MICCKEQTPCGGFFDYDTKSEKLEEVERELEDPEIWNNPERAQQLGKERSLLSSIVGGLDNLKNRLSVRTFYTCT